MRRPARPGFGQYAVYPPYSASLPGVSGLGCGCSMRAVGDAVPQIEAPPVDKPAAASTSGGGWLTLAVVAALGLAAGAALGRSK